MNKKHIAQSFGKASQTYDKDAPVQKWTAQYLCDYVSQTNVETPESCLEIGCGTGFLSEDMLALYPNANWVISDLSVDMLKVCENRIGTGVDFLQMDGEHPTIDQKFDLIVSSLAVQWFQDLPQGLNRLSELLNPGGRVVFTTLGAQSFIEWRKHLEKNQKEIGIHEYPSVDTFNVFSFKDCDFTTQNEHRIQEYQSGLAFLKALKTIGAQEPRTGYAPIAAGTLRSLLNRFDASSITYDILLGDIHKRKDR